VENEIERFLQTLVGVLINVDIPLNSIKYGNYLLQSDDYVHVLRGGFRRGVHNLFTGDLALIFSVFFKNILSAVSNLYDGVSPLEDGAPLLKIILDQPLV